MRPQTQNLKERVAGADSLQEKLGVLQDAYAGDRCYLLACGPSINAYWNERARQFLSDKLVIAVKQTHDLAPEVVDFHLLNSWNYRPYAYDEPGPIVVASRADDDPETPGMQADLSFRVPEPRNYAKRLATTYHFDEWLLTRTLDRPWGPGIVYELGIYLMVHLGVADVVSLGWDLGERHSPVMEHFFAEEPEGSGESDGILNKPRIRSFEVDDLAASTRALYYWLRAKGISLSVVSDRSLVDASVPRISLYDAPRSHEIHRIELAAHGAFAPGDGSAAHGWVCDPSSSCVGTGRASNGRDPAVSLLPTSNDGETRYYQEVPIDRYFQGGTLRARMRARCSEPHRLSLDISLLRGRGDPQPILESLEHPGDDRWRCVDLEVKLPDSIPIPLVQFGAVLRGDAAKPACVERITVLLEK
jgi:hypothetical protein